MKWISVKDQLPPKDTAAMYLVYLIPKNFGDAPYEIGIFIHGEWQLFKKLRTYSISPTHWMPLPEPPKNED